MLRAALARSTDISIDVEDHRLTHVIEVLSRRKGDRTELEEAAVMAWLCDGIHSRDTRHSRLFADLTETSRRVIAQSIQCRWLEPRQLLCREGEIGDCCYVVLRGRLAVYEEGCDGLVPMHWSQLRRLGNVLNGNVDVALRCIKATALKLHESRAKSRALRSLEHMLARTVHSCAEWRRGVTQLCGRTKAVHRLQVSCRWVLVNESPPLCVRWPTTPTCYFKGSLTTISR